ncbi:hypothetical protein BD414DRAFT_80105 [Trametes punicea]|nr:hypothetical protein BD414DRAFT_80105 [Trametes punicea]
MLQVIKDVVKNPSEEEGIALYVIIRSPRHTRQSCISFNIWPCLPTTVEPMWSNPIAVVMSGPRQETYPLWALRLEKMSFSVKFPPAPVEPSGVQRTEIQFGEGAGIIVYLDTGSSTSELPLDYINQIRRIFYHEGDLTGDSDDTVRTPYLVPNEVELDDSFVDLTFLSPGLERDEKVTVRCPLDPFICSLEPITENGAREGLIWITSDSGRQPNAALEGILGLNFFQAMFVALHKPAPSQDKRPYVRIATQWPNEIHSFVLPSIADNKV